MIVVLQPNVSGRRAIAVAEALADAGALARVIVPRATWDAFAKDARASFKEADWAVMAGSLPRRTPIYGPAELVGAARSRDAGVLVDLRGEVLGSALVEGPDVVVISAREATTALGRGIDDPDDATWAAGEFLRGSGKTTKLVVIRGRTAIAYARREDQAPRAVGLEGKVDPARFLAALAIGLDGKGDEMTALGRVVQAGGGTLPA